jgi:cytosine/adenosine deaminase-related metal-dependent hydrolase
MSADAIYTRTMLGAAQMLLSGTTATVDFLFEAPEITIETLEPVVRAYKDIGMRATILLGVADKPFLASLPVEGDISAAGEEADPPSIEGILEVANAAADRWHEPGGQVAIGLGPSAPQRCSDELMQATMSLARERELTWQTHVLETRTQAVTSREWHDGRSFVEVLNDQGLLGPPAALAHTIWLTERDIELMSTTDTTALHCLMSNLRLGDGIAKLPALQRAGVNTALGTDGRGCDETYDMLELARMTALIHKARGEHFDDWTTARDVLGMTTRNASRCTGHGESLGRIEVGAKGDLVVWNRNSITFTPMHEPLRQLVFGGRPGDIRNVVVGGSSVVQDGTIAGVDLDSLLRDARHHADGVRLDPKEGLAELEKAVRGLDFRGGARFMSGVDVNVGAIIVSVVMKV